MRYLAAILAIALLALPVAAHHRKGHQWDDYAEWRLFPCPVFEALEKEYRWDITLYDVMGWGDPKEIAQTRRKLIELLDIEANVCHEV